ncbi:hypothetical protein EJ03DRAFT_80480 [Teratosphaeria nubilosa]|uniref:Uncharacterized protein n=1 Tax=Teratosphaeria nubilosa TaxID=161662 RepID=A0A6G1LB69_9PEZI|nr:hypothetical protein EJ03DRAFT_80480 [Teratosphaeria nubilosa]
MSRWRAWKKLACKLCMVAIFGDFRAVTRSRIRSSDVLLMALARSTLSEKDEGTTKSPASNVYSTLPPAQPPAIDLAPIWLRRHRDVLITAAKTGEFEIRAALAVSFNGLLWQSMSWKSQHEPVDDITNHQ